MLWRDILDGVETEQNAGDGSRDIRGVQYDSRRVGPGDVFVAMRGGTADGNAHIAAALARGAAAVVTDSATVFEERAGGMVPVALVRHGRKALAEVSSVVFGRPQDGLKVSAVTGTNGKTTTAFLLEQMLTSVGRKCLLIGTIETRVAGEVRASEHTTPESRDLLALFADAVRAGCTEVVMEMSSHALEQERVWGTPVDVAIFTNLTQDHLDYHGTMGAYAAAKARLFAGVGTAPPRVAVIREMDDASSVMREAYGGKTLMSYAVDSSYGDYRAEDVQTRIGDTHFRFVTPEGSVAVRSSLSGRVNVENLLAAMCAALARGLTLAEVVEAAAALRPVPGRFEVVEGSAAAGITVVVDYAHTDDALRNLIRLAREAVGEQGGKVITMFGCGGDRDRSKRRKMGRASGEDSDLVIVTSDNPRSEEPMSIINEAVLGVRETHTTFVVEEDRRAAIEVAIRAAKPGDIVLLAGKGHEKTQTFADGAVAFDDVAVAAEVLRGLQREQTANGRYEDTLEDSV